MTTRQTFMALMALMALIAAAAISLPQLASAEEDKVQLLFVQTAEDMKADGKT